MDTELTQLQTGILQDLQFPQECSRRLIVAFLFLTGCTRWPPWAGGDVALGFPFPFSDSIVFLLDHMWGHDREAGCGDGGGSGVCAMSTTIFHTPQILNRRTPLRLRSREIQVSNISTPYTCRRGSHNNISIPRGPSPQSYFNVTSPQSKSH